MNSSELPYQEFPLSLVPAQATPSPPDHHQTSAHRILHVYHEGLTHRHGHIFDADRTTELYTIKAKIGGLFSSKPHVTIYAATTNAVIGTVSFNVMSANMDLAVHNQSIPMKWSGLLLNAHKFRSLATGSLYKWKLDGLTSMGDIVCQDQGEQLIARFEASNFALQKEGKFELGPGVSGVLMDEIVVSGLAMVEYRRQRQGK